MTRVNEYADFTDEELVKVIRRSIAQANVATAEGARRKISVEYEIMHSPPRLSTKITKRL